MTEGIARQLLHVEHLFKYFPARLLWTRMLLGLLRIFQNNKVCPCFVIVRYQI